MEYRKGKCEAGGLFCDYCTKTPSVIQGPVLPVPRPFPDPSRLPDHHYKKCSETPITDAAGNYRLPDDFQPIFQLRSLFSNGLISSDDKAAINNFSTKFVVSEKLVMDYLSHLENLKLRKEKRSEDRKISKAKQLSLKYEDFNWKKMFETNNLKSLTVNVLKKYLIKHNLPITKTKKGIIDTIINHICMLKGNAFVAVKKGRTQNIGEEMDELANETDINSSDNSDDSDFESDNEENTVIKI